MPVHVDEFRTDEGVTFDTPIFPATASRSVVLSDFGLTLRKLDTDQTKYDPMGKYYETVVTLENWKAEGLTELFGFETIGFVDPIIENQDPLTAAKISFQLSNDDGATWLVWVDGPDAWLPAVGIYAGLFNDETTVDLRFPLFPFSAPRQLRLRVKLTPGLSGIQRPVLFDTIIYNKHRMDLYEDVTRSMKRYIDDAIHVPMFFYADISVPSPTVLVEQEIGLDVKIVEPIKVFNTTTDPGKNIDLFVAIAPDGRTILMSGPQVGKIEVQFVGVPDVFIGAEEFFQISKIPSVVVSVTSMKQYLNIRNRAPERERSLARMVGRMQFTRLYYRIKATVRVQSSLKREALQMTDAIERILDQGQCFKSVSNGECYCVMEQINSVAEDRVAQGLFVGAVNLDIIGKIWLTDEIEPGTKEGLAGLAAIDGKVPLVREVELSVGGVFTCNLNIPPHLRRVYRERFPIND